MKFTIFQKKLGTPIGKDILTKLQKEKSDFFILPQRCLVPPNENPSQSAKSYQNHLDALLDLSVSYQGTVLGGTLWNHNHNQPTEVVPIIKDMSLIDQFQRTLSPDHEWAFIISGIRFSFLIGRDSENSNILDALSEKKVPFVFCLDSEPSLRSYEEDLEYFAELARTRKWNLFRVCGFQEEPYLAGRSLFATPSGIQWKVGKSEETKEILKTIQFNLPNPFL